MSDKARNFLAILLIVFLAGSAFFAGFFTNDIIESRLNNTSFINSEDFNLFWEAWGYIEENFFSELPTSKEMTYGAIHGVFEALNDPYTIFVEPVDTEHERQFLQGTFGGIGAYLRRPEDGGPIVLEPIPGNPAEIAGILLDDILLAVDGVEITPEMSVSEVADMIKGEKGTLVVLTVKHPGDENQIDIEITRDTILLPSVSYRLVPEDETIGYIQLTRFSNESVNELREAIMDLQELGADKIILDLRGNGGGLLVPAVEIADLFLTDGTILYQQTKNEGEKVFNATEETLVPDIPLAIMIDQGTASASEILAGALQDRDRATIVGTKSFGKGSVQLVIELSDGSSVHVTSAKWFTPDRQPIDQHGIEPDIPVEITQEAIENGRDEVLARTIEYIQSEN